MSFAFATKIEGFSPSVVATIYITKLKDGGSELEVFYHRQGTTTAWVPSAGFRVRKLQYESDLQEKLRRIDAARSTLELLWESGQVKHDEYYARRKNLDDAEHNARLSTLTLVYQAKMEDLAQMPRTTFTGMDEAAERYFALVQKNHDAIETENN